MSVYLVPLLTYSALNIAVTLKCALGVVQGHVATILRKKFSCLSRVQQQRHRRQMTDRQICDDRNLESERT